MVEQIKQATPQVQWRDVTVAHDKGRECEITLPHNCSIKAIVFRDGDNYNLEIRRFNVLPELQGSGIERILLDKLIEEARGHKATTASGSIESEGGLQSLASVFGAENMRLTAPHSSDVINLDQALVELAKPHREAGVAFTAPLPEAEPQQD